jgi:hypothetical protein
VSESETTEDSAKSENSYFKALHGEQIYRKDQLKLCDKVTTMEVRLAHLEEVVKKLTRKR